MSDQMGVSAKVRRDPEGISADHGPKKSTGGTIVEKLRLNLNKGHGSSMTSALTRKCPPLIKMSKRAPPRICDPARLTRQGLILNGLLLVPLPNRLVGR